MLSNTVSICLSSSFFLEINDTAIVTIAARGRAIKIGSYELKIFPAAKESTPKINLHNISLDDSALCTNNIQKILVIEPVIIPAMAAAFGIFLKNNAPMYIGKNDAAQSPKKSAVPAAMINDTFNLGR